MKPVTRVACTAAIMLLAASVASCDGALRYGADPAARSIVPSPPTRLVLRPLPASAPQGLRRLVDGGIEQVGKTTSYDATYRQIPYPNGDVPLDTGACSDVIVRAFRKAGLDLQKAVHEDMAAHFGAYPDLWGASGPDTNIDHRRVLNLRTFFRRKGKAVPPTGRAADYRPGDVVAWQTDPGEEHIGLVTDYWAPATGHWAIVDNRGRGAQIEDVLFEWKIIGHYRYF